MTESMKAEQLLGEHPVRTAVAQVVPGGLQPEAALLYGIALFQQAQNGGAQLVVSPEAFLSAYPRGMGFDPVDGSRAENARDLYLEYWNAAIDSLEQK